MTKIQKDVETAWKGKTVVFKGINVYICESCGEEAYEPDDVKAMQYFIEGTINPTFPSKAPNSPYSLDPSK
jgi:YgiT-type zinc finger domain-containing protein